MYMREKYVNFLENQTNKTVPIPKYAIVGYFLHSGQWEIIDNKKTDSAGNPLYVISHCNQHRSMTIEGVNGSQLVTVESSDAYDTCVNYQIVPRLLETQGKCVVSGGHHGHIIRTDGTLLSFGKNNKGQLGIGFNQLDTLRPRPVIADIPWLLVACGDDYSMGIQENGSLWGWGNNYSGQLGNGHFRLTGEPVAIQPQKKWKWIACGFAHTLAIDENDMLWAWGYNGLGQLGTGDIEPRVIPEKVSNDPWLMISAKGNQSAGIRKDGTLWIWGERMFSERFSENYDDSVPQQIGTEDDWVYVNSSALYHLAIKKDGTIWFVAGAETHRTPINYVTHPFPIVTNEPIHQFVSSNDCTLFLSDRGLIDFYGTTGFPKVKTTTAQTPWTNFSESRNTEEMPCYQEHPYMDIALAESHMTGIDYNGHVWFIGKDYEI